MSNKKKSEQEKNVAVIFIVRYFGSAKTCREMVDIKHQRYNGPVNEERVQLY